MGAPASTMVGASSGAGATSSAGASTAAEDASTAPRSAVAALPTSGGAASCEVLGELDELHAMEERARARERVIGRNIGGESTVVVASSSTGSAPFEARGGAMARRRILLTLS